MKCHLNIIYKKELQGNLFVLQPRCGPASLETLLTSAACIVNNKLAVSYGELIMMTVSVLLLTAVIRRESRLEIPGTKVASKENNSEDTASGEYISEDTASGEYISEDTAFIETKCIVQNV